MAQIPSSLSSRVQFAGSKERGQAQIAGAIANLGQTVFNQIQRAKEKSNRIKVQFESARLKAIDNRKTAEASSLYLDAEYVFRRNLQGRKRDYLSWEQSFEDWTAKTKEEIDSSLDTDEQKDAFNLIYVNSSGRTRRDISQEVSTITVEHNRASLNNRLANYKRLYAQTVDEDRRVAIAAIATLDITKSQEVGDIEPLDAQTRLINVENEFTTAKIKGEIFNDPTKAMIKLNKNEFNLFPVEKEEWRIEIQASIENREADTIRTQDRQDEEVEKKAKLTSIALQKQAILLSFDGPIPISWIKENSKDLSFQGLKNMRNNFNNVRLNKKLYVDFVRRAREGDLGIISVAEEAYLERQLTKDAYNDILQVFDERNDSLLKAGRRSLDEGILKLGGVLGDDLSALRNSQAQREFTDWTRELNSKDIKITREAMERQVEVLIKRNTTTAIEMTQRPRFFQGNTLDHTEEEINELVFKTKEEFDAGRLTESEFKIEKRIINKFMQLTTGLK